MLKRMSPTRPYAFDSSGFCRRIYLERRRSVFVFRGGRQCGPPVPSAPYGDKGVFDFRQNRRSQPVVVIGPPTATVRLFGEETRPRQHRLAVLHLCWRLMVR